MLAVVHAGAESLHSSDNDIQGELRVAVPSDIGRNVLLPLITRFCQRYPKISLRLSLSDEISDVFRDPVDIAIRYGVLDNSSYVALPLAEDNRRVLAASRLTCNNTAGRKFWTTSSITTACCLP
jgi:DNA-binding transcriptional LysR family regulator